MMPSRGIHAGLRALRGASPSMRPTTRLFSSSLSNGFARPGLRPALVTRSIAEQRRNISWNPATWLPSNNEVKPFEDAHKSPAVSQSPSEPSAATSTPVQPVPAAQAAPQIPQGATTTSTDPAFPDLTNVNIPDPAQAPLPIPLETEQIGYLHSLGLEYGWGPTSMLEWLLEHIHVYTGLPWWSSIVITSIIIRLGFFPLLMKTSDVQARMSHVKPKLDEHRQKMMAALKNKDQPGAMAARTEMQILSRRAGVSQVPIFSNLALNLVFTWCSLKLLRHMAELPVPAFPTGGAFWFTDLTASDPYLILPAVMAGAMHATLRLGAAEGGMDVYSQTPGMRVFMLYGLPGLVFISMAYFSAAVTLWLGASGMVSIIGGQLLQRPWFRERFDLTMPSKNKGTGIQGMVSQMLGEEPAKTVDAKKVEVKKGHVGNMEYQKPEVRTTGRKTQTPSSPPFSSATAAARSASNAPAPEVAQPAQPKQSPMERYVEWGADKINEVGGMYSKGGKAVGGWLKRAAGRPDLTEAEKARKDFEARALNYEQRARAKMEAQKKRAEQAAEGRKAKKMAKEKGRS